MNVLHALTILANDLDASGDFKAADLIDDAIRKISRYPGAVPVSELSEDRWVILGEPTRETGGQMWQSWRKGSETMRVPVGVDPNQNLEVAQQERATHLEPMIPAVEAPKREIDWSGAKNYWGQAKKLFQGFNAADDQMNDALDPESSGLTLEKLDELINILQVLRMEMDPDFGPEEDMEPTPEDPYLTESAWSYMRKSEGLD
jgi:hypothetical protein